MKKILFVHNNFPAQFRHLAWTLARNPEVTVAAIGSTTATPISGVKLLKYSVMDTDVSAAHPFARRFDLECRRAEQVLYATSTLSASGFIPDVVFGHPGWGETLPLRSIFPKARILTYCEFFYRTEGQDLGFDPEFPETGVDGHVNVHLKNASTLLALDECDLGISPTDWQRSTYPTEYQDKIRVLHEGVDTDLVKPKKNTSFRVPSGRELTTADEVITFATRNHEPLRGFHIFMRALPQIMRARPKAQILIIGGQGGGYGLSPPAGHTWQSIFFNEVAAEVDKSRIHFVGHLQHHDFVRALQISRAHIYLTYPFVLSWSLLEAMSAGSLVIGSDTTPVRDVVDGTNGILVPFFDIDELADRTIDALANPRRFQPMRAKARKSVVERFDLKRVCLPALLNALEVDPAESDFGALDPELALDPEDA